MQFFQTKLLEPASQFLLRLDENAARKVIYNIKLASMKNDPRLFKKLNEDIWEFRTRFNSSQIRLFAFQTQTEESGKLVVITHGFIKKTSKIPEKEIQRARHLKFRYLMNKK